MNCKGRFVNKEKVFYYKTQTHTHIHSISERTILEVLKRSLNTKAHTHTYWHICVPSPSHRRHFSRGSVSISKINPNPDISASQQALTYSTHCFYSSLSAFSLSQYSFLPLTAGSNSVRPLGDHVWKSHASHDFLLVREYSTRLINCGGQFWRLNYIRKDRGVNRIVNSVHSNVRSNAVFLVWLISKRSCVFWQENGEQHIKFIYYTHTWFKSVGLVIFFMF